MYPAVSLIPPYSLAILAVLVAGVWYARRHMLVWATVPFVVVHAIIAHKEPRFLFRSSTWWDRCSRSAPMHSRRPSAHDCSGGSMGAPDGRI